MDDASLKDLTEIEALNNRLFTRPRGTVNAKVGVRSIWTVAKPMGWTHV